jgi:hypothetical protein
VFITPRRGGVEVESFEEESTTKRRLVGRHRNKARDSTPLSVLEPVEGWIGCVTMLHDHRNFLL